MKPIREKQMKTPMVVSPVEKANVRTVHSCLNLKEVLSKVSATKEHLRSDRK